MGYVLSAWGLTLVTGAVFALSVVRKGRRLCSQVAPEQRRWMSAPSPDARPEAGEAAAAGPTPGSALSRGPEAAKR